MSHDILCDLLLVIGIEVKSLGILSCQSVLPWLRSTMSQHLTSWSDVVIHDDSVTQDLGKGLAHLHCNLSETRGRGPGQPHCFLFPSAQIPATRKSTQRSKTLGPTASSQPPLKPIALQRAALETAAREGQHKQAIPHLHPVVSALASARLEGQ